MARIDKITYYDGDDINEEVIYEYRADDPEAGIKVPPVKSRVILGGILYVVDEVTYNLDDHNVEVILFPYSESYWF